MRGQTSQAPGGGWDARACKGEEGCLSFHLKVLKSTFTAKHTPSIAHSELCVLDSLAELALGGKKREVAVTLRSITSGSLSPLPPHQRGSQSGLSCLSVALEGCCPQHSPPLGGTEGRAVWASPPRPHGSYGGGRTLPFVPSDCSAPRCPQTCPVALPSFCPPRAYSQNPFISLVSAVAYQVSAISHLCAITVYLW